MTDTLTPGSEWLLPVTSEEYTDLHKILMQAAFVGQKAPPRPGDWAANLIPAARLTDLEAEVARWQQLYEDARHDLTKAEIEVERLQGWLRDLDPYLDQLICYASTQAEHPPNRIVAEVLEYLAALNPKD